MRPELPFYEQWDFWVSIGTMLLAGVTAWLAIETRRIRRGSDEAMADMRKYASDSAAAATTSAKAAEQSADAAKSLVEIGNRAWVALKQIETIVRSTNGLPIRFATTLENGGRSPALELRFAQWSKIAESLPNPPDYQGFNPMPKGSIGPGLQGQIPNDVAYTPADEAAVFDGRKKLYVYGFARYKDVFGVEHETKWALEYSRATQQFTSCALHNEMT